MFKEVMNTYSDSCLQLMLGSVVITLGVIILLCFLAQSYGRERSPDTCTTGRKLSLFIQSITVPWCCPAFWKSFLPADGWLAAYRTQTGLCGCRGFLRPFCTDRGGYFSFIVCGIIRRNW